MQLYENLDTRYESDVSRMYANIMAVITGKNADEFIKACEIFTKQHIKEHEQNRYNFKPICGFFDKINEINTPLEFII
jgi:hypothetical protein